LYIITGTQDIDCSLMCNKNETIAKRALEEKRQANIFFQFCSNCFVFGSKDYAQYE